MNRPPRRVATEAERAFFHEMLRDAKPFKKQKREAMSAPAPRAAQAAPPHMPAANVRPPPRSGDAPAPPIGGHREAHLRRGRLEPESRIDLHGLTQDEAYRALLRVFARAHDFDQRLVLVITGKGGVLRTLVPRWFGETEFRRFVRGVSPAHVVHGGGGALYVLLRRKQDAARKR